MQSVLPLLLFSIAAFSATTSTALPITSSVKPIPGIVIPSRALTPKDSSRPPPPPPTPTPTPTPTPPQQQPQQANPQQQESRPLSSDSPTLPPTDSWHCEHTLNHQKIPPEASNLEMCGRLVYDTSNHEAKSASTLVFPRGEQRGVKPEFLVSMQKVFANSLANWGRSGEGKSEKMDHDHPELFGYPLYLTNGGLLHRSVTTH